MAVPPLCMACYLYGLRPLLLCGIAMLTGNLCDRLVSLLRHRVYQNGDLSNESFALVIALLMPDCPFRLAFTNGLMSESMMIWFAVMALWSARCPAGRNDARWKK